MGSALVTPDLHAVDEHEWAALLTRVVAALAQNRQHRTDGNSAVKVQINSERCQGHGRCYDLAPDLFGDDDEGFGQGSRRRRRAAGQGARGAPRRCQLPRARDRDPRGDLT